MYAAYKQKTESADHAQHKQDFDTNFRHPERTHVLIRRVPGHHTFTFCLMGVPRRQYLVA